MSWRAVRSRLAGRLCSATRAAAPLSLVCLLIACRKEMVFEVGPIQPLEEQPSGLRDGWADRPDECVDLGPALNPQWEWAGMSYDQAFSFTGSSRLRLQMPDEATDGWVLFGSYSQLPPPLPSEACYPQCAFTRSTGAALPRPLEGFMYPMRRADSVTQGRQRLEFDVHAPWEEWCQNQTPVRAAGEGYTCAPTGRVRFEGDNCLDPQDNPGPLEACCLERLCNQARVCDCDADGCRASDAKAHLEIISYPTKEPMIAVTDRGGIFLMEPAERLGSSGDAGGIPSDPKDGGLPNLQ